MTSRPLVVVLLAILAVRPAAVAQGPPPWPDTFTARLEAMALLQTLNANLLASRSSTVTLEAWCRDHQLATTPAIVARPLAGAVQSPTAEQRQRLDVSSAADVRYRHVRLECGTRVLSIADNWYVPGRLTAEMNRTLDTTDTPFGRAVAPLEPYRRTFSVQLLWSPLPDGWERGSAMPPAPGAGALDIPPAVLEHRAVLYTKNHEPFAEVREVYQRDVLAFSPPRGRP